MPDLLVKRLIPATSYKSGEVCIFHPGYFDQEPLLRLIGYDDTEGGIWREVAETACAIISNNASEGVLKNQDGVVMQQNILTPGHYWWHLPVLKYAIIVEFRNWRFPETVPVAWQTSQIDEPLRNRCVLTSQRFGSQQAHMIPRGETEWFETNRMGTRFSRNNRSNSVDDSDNVITLRSDLHTGFDQKLFAFAPKNKKMMVHCMDRDAADYHNLPLEANVCQEFLLARFAWTLYPICLAPWLKMKRPRLIWVDVNGSLQAKELSGEECQRIAHASKPRSTSPKKRKMEDIPAINPPSPTTRKRRSDTSFDSALGPSNDEEDDVDIDLGVGYRWEEQRRGRKRLRDDYDR